MKDETANSERSQRRRLPPVNAGAGGQEGVRFWEAPWETRSLVHPAAGRLPLKG